MLCMISHPLTSHVGININSVSYNVPNNVTHMTKFGIHNPRVDHEITRKPNENIICVIDRNAITAPIMSNSRHPTRWTNNSERDVRELSADSIPLR